MNTAVLQSVPTFELAQPVPEAQLPAVIPLPPRQTDSIALAYGLQRQFDALVRFRGSPHGALKHWFGRDMAPHVAAAGGFVAAAVAGVWAAGAGAAWGDLMGITPFAFVGGGFVAAVLEELVDLAGGKVTAKRALTPEHLAFTRGLEKDGSALERAIVAELAGDWLRRKSYLSIPGDEAAASLERLASAELPESDKQSAKRVLNALHWFFDRHSGHLLDGITANNADGLMQAVRALTPEEARSLGTILIPKLWSQRGAARLLMSSRLDQTELRQLLAGDARS